jgi:hypothetical protein
MTTFTSYGAVQSSRQSEIMRELSQPAPQQLPSAHEFVEAVARLIKRDASS